jgi:hypothetical protein
MIEKIPIIIVNGSDKVTDDRIVASYTDFIQSKHL